MAMYAFQIEMENPVIEERVARLESDVAHIRADIKDMKDEMREMRRDIASLALSMEKGFAAMTRWGIGLYIGLVAGLATAFMWLIQRLPPM